MRCNEAFAGAAQRKAYMEQQRQHQQNMQNANVWGGVAASFLGAAAGSALSHSWSDESYSSGESYSSYDDSPASADSFDIAGVSDDTTDFDFSDD